MLIATKKNRQLRIPDEKRKAYESMGYKITDADGNVISEPVDQAKVIKNLEKENAALKAKLAAYEGKAEKAAESAEAAETEKPKPAVKTTAKKVAVKKTTAE